MSDLTNPKMIDGFVVAGRPAEEAQHLRDILELAPAERGPALAKYLESAKREAAEFSRCEVRTLLLNT